MAMFLTFTIQSLRKLDIRVSLILEATRKNGGVYLYSNCRGAGGERLYYVCFPKLLLRYRG